MRLRPNVADQMCRAGSVAVDVAIEAGDASPAVGVIRLAVGGGVELLLRELRHQQAHAFQILGVENAVEELLEVIDRKHLALRDIAEVRAGGQVDGRWKLRQEVFGQIEIEIEALQPGQLLDFHLREDHAAYLVMRMRQRQEPLRELILVADFLG